MVVHVGKRYVLGGYWLEPARQLLLRDDESIHLSKKPFQVLLYLIEHRERFVSTSELLEQFWNGKEVYDDTVRKCVAAVRKALDDRTGEPRFIETRWGWGYRYVGPFEEQTTPAEPHASEHEKAYKPPSAGQSEEAQAVPPAREDTTSSPAPNSRPAPPTPKIPVRFLALLGMLLAIMLAAVALNAHRESALPAEARKTATPPPPRSIAVLPLKNLTEDPANDYLSDGITESLINALSKIRELKVISRGTAFNLKGREVDPQELRQRLGVATFLQGSVSRSDGRVRVEVRLVSTEDGRVLWAGAPYDRAPDDIFALQDEIARNVVNELAARLSAEDERRLIERPTGNAGAYEAYLRGRYEWYKRTKAGLNKSLEYFQEAIERDPNYAPAYAGMADYYVKGVWFLYLPPREATEKAKAAARRALELDDKLAAAHLALAGAYQMEWAWADSAREIERALEIDPNNAEAHHDYAYAMLFMGQTDRAVAEIKRARELDPLSVVANVDVGEILLYARRYDEAVAALRHAIEMEPNRANAHWDLACALQQQGAEREAFEEYIRNVTLNGRPPEMLNALREAYAGAGMPGFWRKLLELRLEQARHSYVLPVHLAQLYAQVGDHERAFAHIEQAYRERSPSLAALKADPLLDPLRDDPRFARLAARVGL
ncbi:MAG: tetratricopeptide repeat protein [Pyrinomonadaceae bacterium]